MLKHVVVAIVEVIRFRRIHLLMFMTRISVVGHSEGGAITTRVTIDNPITKIKNIVLMAARIQNTHDLLYHTFVRLLLEYAKQVLDKNHTGSISIQQAVKDPLFGQYIAFSLTNNQNYSANVTTNTTDLGTLNKLLFLEEVVVAMLQLDKL